MRTRRRASIQDLRLAIDCLPARTKIAMLEGIDTNPIIVGAYSTREGICPMLAAHRAGGRTDLIAFARAWDRLASGGGRRLKARRATQRELLILRTHLEASLLEQEHKPLAAAIAEHRALLATHPADPPASGTPRPRTPRPRDATHPADPPASGTPRPGDPDRACELRATPGWSWTRLFRRYDDYAQAIERVGEQEREPTPA